MGYKIKPKDFPCRLDEIENGLFLCEDTFCLKTDYNDYYICENGDAFWGGTSDKTERGNIIVTPVEIIKVDSLDEE